MTKQIVVALSGLTNTIYAVRKYTTRGNNVVSSAKDDVTAQAIQAVVGHARTCINETCECDGLREAARNNYHVKGLSGLPVAPAGGEGSAVSESSSEAPAPSPAF